MRKEKEKGEERGRRRGRRRGRKEGGEMPSNMAMIEEFMTSTNRPWSCQLVTDNMQKHGIKKTAVQKILDELVDKNVLVSKVSE